MRVLLTMGVVFILLVYPQEILNLTYTLSWIVHKDNGIDPVLAFKLNKWLKLIRTANSCANIFIYAHMQSRFRRYILRIFYNVGCCRTNYLRTTIYSISQISPSTRSRFSLAKKAKLSYTRASVQSSPLLKGRRDSKSRTVPESPVFFQRAQLWKTGDIIGGMPSHI